jgi:hypothetical protein
LVEPAYAGPQAGDRDRAAPLIILRYMAEGPYEAEGPPSDEAWLRLGAAPGLCGACAHAKLNQTRRGTAYLRCTRAEWDAALVRYPRLPVTECAGFERRPDQD